MKSIKIYIVLLLLAAATQMNAQRVGGATKPAHSFPPQDVAYVQSQFINGMVDFVEAVRPFYTVGDSYQQFKVKVLIGYQQNSPRTALPILPSEGEAMLQKAYKYLKSGLTPAQVRKEDNGKTIAEAYVFTLEEQKRGRSSLDAQAALFGGNKIALDKSSDLSRAVGKKKCKWWQLACHLVNVATWVNNNAPVIISATQTILEFLAIFK